MGILVIEKKNRCKGGSKLITQKENLIARFGSPREKERERERKEKMKRHTCRAINIRHKFNYLQPFQDFFLLKKSQKKKKFFFFLQNIKNRKGKDLWGAGSVSFFKTSLFFPPFCAPDPPLLTPLGT